MISVTLGQLKTAVRERSNMEGSEFISESELTRYINQSASELYDLLVASFEDYFMEELVFSYTSDDGYTLPSDFYKLRGVDFQSGSDWIVVNPFNFLQRNKPLSAWTMTYSGAPYNVRQYRIVGNTIRMVPIGQATGTYRLWYIPSWQQLSSDSDSTSLSFEGWDEYVVIDAAIKCLQKEESDVSVLFAQKQALAARIRAMAAGRDAGQPESVSDVRTEMDRWWH